VAEAWLLTVHATLPALGWQARRVLPDALMTEHWNDLDFAMWDMVVIFVVGIIIGFIIGWLM
jgi:hypothetical protein